MKPKLAFLKNLVAELLPRSLFRLDKQLLRFVEFLALLLCLLCAGLVVAMNCAGRSLWFDEAMLVWSIENRSLGTLVSTPLDWVQTAPVLYLYMLKLLTLILGHSEAIYRLPSVASCILLPLVTWFAAQKLFRIPCPWVCAAFVANMPALFTYSNQVKPYAFEAFCSLLVLICWWCYSEKRLSWWMLSLCWSFLALSGNPPWFLVAGCIAVEFVYSVFHREFQSLYRILACSLLCIAFLGVYYWLWLRPVATGDGMQNYWMDSMLPFPATPSRIRAFFTILSNSLFVPAFGKRLLFILPMLGLSLVFAVRSRSRLVLAVWLAFGGAVVASCLRMFPISLRIWIFSIPLISLLACWAWWRFLRGVFPAALVAASLLVFAFANLGVVKFRHPLACHMEGEEINASLDYLRSHLRDGDSVYVFLWSNPAFQFKNGYGNPRMLPTSRDNLIWGGAIGDTQTFERDLAAIEDSAPCWLVAAHAFQNSNEEVVRAFLERLDEAGTLVLADNSFSTPLYRYDKSP